MERRYLAATLALAVTFAVFSGEFCTRYLSKVPHSTAELKAEIACARTYVAKQLMAKLESFAGQRESEPPPMLAELTIPELPEAPVAAVAAVPPAASKCPLMKLSPKAPQPVIQMRVMAGDAGNGLSDLSIVRAELLSERAQQWQALADQRTIEINIQSLEHAQKISARAMEKAQRQMEKTRHNLALPATPGTAMHINFVAPTITVTPEVPTASVF